MKKTFMILMGAEVLATGCSKDSTVDTAGIENNAIGFRAIPNKTQTKVTETTVDNMTNFVIYGKWSESSPADFSFMKATVTKSGSSWTYNPLKYWPEAGTIDWYGYSPAATAGLTEFAETATAPVIEYTVPTTLADQIDLVVTEETGTSSVTGTVNLTFKHALSQIVFEAKNFADGLTYTISDIKLHSLNTEGDFDLSTLSSAAIWTNPVTPADFTMNMTAAATDIAYVDEVTPTFVAISDAVVVLPQALTAGTNAGENYISITYSAEDAGGNEIESKTVQMSLDGVTNDQFEIGKKYIFRLSLGASKSPIEFDVAVAGWDEGGTVTLPL